MDGESRILRYAGDEFPHKHAQPITDDYKRSPYTWYEQCDTNEVPWLDVLSGPEAGTAHKWLNRHRDTGGGVILLHIPPGWHGVGTAAKGTVEEFVIAGMLEARGAQYREWGYACHSTEHRAASMQPSRAHGSSAGGM
jgi:hypothetical protein